MNERSVAQNAHEQTRQFLDRETMLRDTLEWDPKDAARYAELYQVSRDTPLSDEERRVVGELEKLYNVPSDFGVFEEVESREGRE